MKKIFTVIIVIILLIPQQSFALRPAASKIADKNGVPELLSGEKQYQETSKESVFYAILDFLNNEADETRLNAAREYLSERDPAIVGQSICDFVKHLELFFIDRSLHYQQGMRAIDELETGADRAAEVLESSPNITVRVNMIWPEFELPEGVDLRQFSDIFDRYSELQSPEDLNALVVYTEKMQARLTELAVNLGTEFIVPYLHNLHRVYMQNSFVRRVESRNFGDGQVEHWVNETIYTQQVKVGRMLTQDQKEALLAMPDPILSWTWALRSFYGGVNSPEYEILKAVNPSLDDLLNNLASWRDIGDDHATANLFYFSRENGMSLGGRNLQASGMDISDVNRLKAILEDIIENSHSPYLLKKAIGIYLKINDISMFEREEKVIALIGRMTSGISDLEARATIAYEIMPWNEMHTRTATHILLTILYMYYESPNASARGIYESLVAEHSSGLGNFDLRVIKIVLGIETTQRIDQIVSEAVNISA